MKEKDIVDFDLLKKNEEDYYIDENGEEIGCNVCYVHNKAHDYFINNTQEEVQIPNPICPYCGKPLERRFSYTDDKCCSVVSETNYANSDGEIGYFSLWECNNKECKSCEKIFALMPVSVAWNANHDIYYTGGKDYIIDKDTEELSNSIYEKIMNSVESYIERKLNPKDCIDENLSSWNIRHWCRYAVEGALATYLYNKGFKK